MNFLLIDTPPATVVTSLQAPINPKLASDLTLLIASC